MVLPVCAQYCVSTVAATCSAHIGDLADLLVNSSSSLLPLSPNCFLCPHLSPLLFLGTRRSCLPNWLGLILGPSVELSSGRLGWMKETSVLACRKCSSRLGRCVWDGVGEGVKEERMSGGLEGGGMESVRKDVV